MVATIETHGELLHGRPHVNTAAWLSLLAGWRVFLNGAMPEAELRDIRRHPRTGRPLGDDMFVAAWRA